MSCAAYRALPGINWSTLRQMDQSPAHYRWAVDHPDGGDTASRRALRGIHAAVLQPGEFDRLHPVFPGRRDLRTGAYQAFLAAHSDADSILSQSEHDTAQAIAAAVRAHPVAGPLLCGSDGESEVNMTWIDAGFACKGRADRIVQVDGAVIVADLKTWRSTDPRLVARGIVDALWHGQLAHYGAGVAALYPGEQVRHRLVVVEQAPPHDVGVYDLDGACIEAGQALRRRLLDRLAECLASGRWPGRCPDLLPVELPEWALPEMEADDDDEQEDMP